MPSYAQVKYEGVYPGVDLVYYGNQRQLEYDFVVAPSAEPDQIKLSFAGADGMRLEAATVRVETLSLTSPHGSRRSETIGETLHEMHKCCNKHDC